MIYLDNSATTKPFDSVAETLKAAMTEDFYNVSSPYSPALKTEKKMLEAKRIIAASLNASEKEIIFTSGGTESDNTALMLAKDNSEVIVSCYEHHAILNCEAFLKKKNCKLILCPVNKNGTVDTDTLRSLVNENTSLVSIMHVNNEIGAVNDIQALVKAVKEKNPSVLFHSDGVQAYMHICTDMKNLGVDLYSVSAHKVHGPKGIGLLYIRKGVPFTPFIYGGGQQDNLRSGTVNVPNIIAFAQAVNEGKNFFDTVKAIKNRYVELLTQIPDTRITLETSAPNILSIAFLGIKASSLQNALENDVIIGKGSACTSRSSKVSHVLEAIGLPLNVAEATVRISFGAFNTVEEADVAADKIKTAVEYLRKYKRK
jgi:cysteine desulfurase